MNNKKILKYFGCYILICVTCGCLTACNNQQNDVQENVQEDLVVESKGEEVTYYIDDDTAGTTGVFVAADSKDYEPVELSGTVMQEGDDKLYSLSSDEAGIIYDMIFNLKWNCEGVAESIDDCNLVICGQPYKYSSSCGCFNDYENKRFLQLSDENMAKVNEILGEYILLE